MITTTIYDAAPLQTTASNISPAPTGDFSLIVGASSESSATCLDSSQSQAWQCTSGAFLSLSVSNPQWDTAQISITNDDTSTKNHQRVAVGSMPPSLIGTAPASLMNDTNDPEYGPALFFIQPFDKLVVLPIDYPLNDSSPSKRSTWSSFGGSSDLVERGTGQYLHPGDQAWLCYWNRTSLEGFIYVERNTSADDNSTAAANSIATTNAAQATSTAPPPASPTPAPGQRRDVGYGVHFWDKAKSDNPGSWPSGVPPLYPRIVKLQERRDPQIRVQPYCEVRQIQDDLSFAPIPGNTTTITLAEQNPDNNDEHVVFAPFVRRGSDASEDSLSKRQNIPGFCHCEWLSQ